MTLDAGLNKTTSTDYRGWLWITIIVSIIYTVSVLVARLFGKYGLLWYDDATMGLAYCIAIARWGILMQAAEHGPGADLAAANLPMNTHNIALMQESKKRMVYTVFAARIGVVAIGISQAVAYTHFLKHHNRASIGLLPKLSLQRLWPMYSFISATIPCMRSFLGAFGSPRLAVISPGNTKQSGYGSQGTALSTLKRSFGSEKGGDASVRVSSKAIVQMVPSTWVTLAE
ncbi:hypothetical protein LTR81_009148 [Elasticomyces elasticus]